MTVITSMIFYYRLYLRPIKKIFFNPYKNKTHADTQKFFLAQFLFNSRFQKTHPVSS